MRGHHHARACGRSAAEGHAGHPLLKQELLLLDPLLLHHQVLLLLLWRHLLEDCGEYEGENEVKCLIAIY
jgi:hypothetical protein